MTKKQIENAKVHTEVDTKPFNTWYLSIDQPFSKIALKDSLAIVNGKYLLMEYFSQFGCDSIGHIIP